ncbi:MAG: ATP-binding cassette domain-containing protein [Caldilineaceae bacterium]
MSRNQRTAQDRRLFAPEVVQTSAMDCGPAALKAMLEGFGIPVSYGRLREACQTSVDGTSIDTIEEVAQQLGLDAQQVMLPADFLFLEDANALPAIAVVRLPNGALHFIVIWNIFGPFVQVMNPAAGRRWLRRQALLDDLYVHTHPVPAAAWRVWAGGDGFLKPLASRLQQVGVTQAQSAALLVQAQQDESWWSLATLDAATRLVDSLVRADALDRGRDTAKLIEQLTEAVAQEPAQAYARIPPSFWVATPVRNAVTPNAEGRPPLLLMRGAVLVTVAGVHGPAVTAGQDENPAGSAAAGEGGEGADETPTAPAPLPPELVAALTEKDVQPFWAIWRLLRQDGLLALFVLLIATVLAALGVTVEALILRGILQASDQIIGVEQRTNALLLILLFGGLMLLIEFILADALARMGRHLDLRLRIAFLEKIPRLSDRYFQSRLVSDMTMRAHELAAVKGFPTMAVQFLRLAMQLVLTTLGVIYFVPNLAGVALLVLLLALLPSLVARPLLQEQDLRYRTHSSGLSRFYLDGLLGLIPLRTHSAEKSLHNAHEMLLTEWFQAGRNLYTFNLWLRGVQVLLSTASVIFILTRYIQQGGELTNVLLLFYWTLNLPLLGQALADTVLQYPALRNRVLRVLEPLGAPNENAAPTATLPTPTPGAAMISLDQVNVVAGGHTILRDLNVTIGAGEHVAIVGASGAGKSSLVGLLLGWHKPAHGTLLVDGQPLQDDALEALRRQTVWVDPAVHLWNRTLLENLHYGNQSADNTGDLLLSDALEEANLYDVLQYLPNGLQTELGEGGGLVSGGQGQRVRLGRGLMRTAARLVILDEPFRGLDRPQRQALLAQVREHWRDATLLFISHDVGDTQGFDRVLVIENGQIVEDAPPVQLAAQPTSTYRQLLNGEDAVRRGLWESTTWRRLWLEEGELRELTR